MRIFVTGATGFVGSAVVRELMDAGHQVTGLARSDKAAEALIAAGAKVHRGSLDEPGSLRGGADAADAVIHTAFIHDFSRYKENCEIDRRAIEALGSALAGSDRPLIVTSATGVLPAGGLATEEMAPLYGPDAPPRSASEQAADAAAARGVHVAVIRLAPSVHGAGDHGFVPMLIGIAREKKLAAFVDKGCNNWPAVHRLDAARLYRLVLEKGAAGGRYHAVGETGLMFRDIAAAIGEGLNVPVGGMTREEAAAHFGWLAHFAEMDIPASSQRTREQLGWRPQEPGLLADMRAGGYFA